MKTNTDLWHAKWDSRMVKVRNKYESEVFSFVRQNEQDKVLAVFNFSDEAKTVEFKENLYYDTYQQFINDKEVSMVANLILDLKPCAFQIFIKP